MHCTPLLRPHLQHTLQPGLMYATARSSTVHRQHTLQPGIMYAIARSSTVNTHYNLVSCTPLPGLLSSTHTTTWYHVRHCQAYYLQHTLQPDVMYVTARLSTFSTHYTITLSGFPATTEQNILFSEVPRVKKEVFRGSL